MILILSILWYLFCGLFCSVATIFFGAICVAIVDDVIKNKQYRYLHDLIYIFIALSTSAFCAYVMFHNVYNFIILWAK